MRPLALQPALECQRLLAQLAVQRPVGLQLQPAIAQLAIAGQRAADAPRQLLEPVGRIEIGQLQVGLPAQRLGEAQRQLALRPALAGLQAQFGQLQLAAVALQRAGQAQRPGRAEQTNVEVALVAAVGIVQRGLQLLQLQLHVGQRIQLLPGEGATLEVQVGGEGRTPVESAGKLQGFAGGVLQLQLLYLRSTGIDSAAQRHAHRLLHPGQGGGAAHLITLAQGAAGVQAETGEAQARRQAGQRLEVAGRQLQFQRQPFGQRLQPATQFAVEIALAVGDQLQPLQQAAIQL
ncbi:hypothetical protein D3C80_646990 [compost metagenome]